MTKRPVLSSYWDERRQSVTHKIEIQGTNKSLLFTDETIRDLQRQIERACGPRGTAPAHGSQQSWSPPKHRHPSVSSARPDAINAAVKGTDDLGSC
jgi:hypothetical protein